jgi:Regulator of ribonuclease activity B
LSQDQPSSPEPRPPGGRPAGSSSRRRRRGRGGGAGGGAGGGSSAGGGGSAGGRPAAASQPSAGAPRTGGGGRSGRGGRGSGRGNDRGGGRRPAPAQPQPQAARELEITDEKIFQRLLDAGLDLGQEAVIEAFLYFAGESQARRIAEQLDAAGYATYVDPNPPGRWLLEAVSRAVPTPEHIAAMGAELRNLARANSGIYDGWWAAEPPEEEEAGAPLPEPEPAEA